MLLPRYDDEEEDDPRTELVEQLLEYQRLKEAACFFRGQGEFGRDIFVRQPENLGDIPQEYRHAPEDLVRAASRMLRRAQRRLPPSPKAFSGIVGREPVPIASRVTMILKRFLTNTHLKFHQLFEDAQSRSEIVATFLAVLELSKLHRVRLEGDGENMELTLTNNKGE